MGLIVKFRQRNKPVKPKADAKWEGEYLRERAARLDSTPEDRKEYRLWKKANPQAM